MITIRKLNFKFNPWRNLTWGGCGNVDFVNFRIYGADAEPNGSFFASENWEG